MPNLAGIVILLLMLLTGIAGGIVGGWGGYRFGYSAGVTDGKNAEAASITKQSNAEGDAAEAARKAALVPGAAARLRANWCRNCP